MGSRKRTVTCVAFILWVAWIALVGLGTENTVAFRWSESAGTNPVTAVAISPDGHLLASASQEIKLWTLETGTLLHTVHLEGLTDKITSLAFDSQDKYLAIAGLDQIIRIISLADYSLVKQITDSSIYVNIGGKEPFRHYSVAFNPTSDVLAIGTQAGSIMLWDIENSTLFSLVSITKGVSAPITAIAYSPYGSCLAIGRLNGFVELYSFGSQRTVWSSKGHTDAITAIAYSPDGKSVASASLDGMVTVWSASSGAIIQRFDHKNAVPGIAYDPTGNYIASACADGKVRVWSLKNGTVVQTISDYGEKTESIAWDKKGTTLIGGTRDGKIRAWNTLGLITQPPIAAFTFQGIVPSPQASEGKAAVQPRTQIPVNFDSSSSSARGGIITWYKWDWNSDGEYDLTTVEPKVTHLFKVSSENRVTLEVIDNKATSSKITKVIRIPQELPQAKFTFNPATPKVREEVSFSNESVISEGKIVSWLWDFGDGITSGEEAPKHIYTHEGEYIVKLKIVDSFNLTSSYIRDLKILPRGVIQAYFTFKVLHETHQVEFNASTSIDTIGKISRYEWDWDGDGTYDASVTNPVISHIFIQPGTHKVTLRVTDNKGAIAKVTKTVTVEANKPPVAAFTVSAPDSCTVVNDAVTFDASNSSDSDGNIVKYEWEFGDGTTGEGKVVTHAFSTPGTYTVKLMVTDNDGAPASIEKEVKVFRYGGQGGPA